MSDEEYWTRLTRTDDVYRDDVNYKLLGSYNSNSYIRGLLDATAGGYTVPFDEYIGGETPLPEHYFDAPVPYEAGFTSRKTLPAPYFRRSP